MNPELILALLFNVVLIGVCSFALYRGGRPERIGAGINLGACFLTALLRATDLRYFAPGEPLDMAIDLAVSTGFFLLAIRTTRFWPIWAFGFALGDVFMSVAGRILPMTPLMVYHTGLGLYAYLALVALALGTWGLPLKASAEDRRGNRR